MMTTTTTQFVVRMGVDATLAASIAPPRCTLQKRSNDDDDDLDENDDDENEMICALIPVPLVAAFRRLAS